MIEILVIIIPILGLIFGIGLTIYGIYLAFKENVILGILVFLIQPLPLLFGILGLFTINLSKKVIELFK